MSLETVRFAIIEEISGVLERELGHRPERVSLEVPPNRDLGDLAWPGALPLAKVLKRAPRDIATAVAEGARWPDAVDRVEIAGPGFLNFFLDRGRLLVDLLSGDREPSEAHAVKTVIEHTNINPNKAAHIGHLRNAVLGDVLVRSLRALGRTVEVQDYIDDTGVQVADVVVGLLHLPEDELAEAAGLPTGDRGTLLRGVLAVVPHGVVPRAATDDFDDLCWAVYPMVTGRYEQDEAFAAHRAAVLRAIEAGSGGLGVEEAVAALAGAADANEPYPDPAVARLGAAVADGNVRCHLATMARLGVAYDLLTHESDILELGFWVRAFDLLREAGALRKAIEGKNAGCWVMSLADSPEFADMDDPDKILVRSNGTVTYTAKDIAYQLWKLGLLTDPDGSPHDFGYRPFAVWRQDGPAAPVVYGGEGTELMRTSSDPAHRTEGGPFGGGDAVFNVIDVRQSYPQKVVREAVRVLGHGEAADASVHFAYEMVALTPAAVRTIEATTGVDFGLSEEAMSKSYVEMSGRRGIGVKADQFLDTLMARAEEAVRERADTAAGAELDERTRAIAVGALRYLMTRQSRNRVLAFDFDEALAFEGDTGPYLQYSAVRAAKIFGKLAERRGEGPVGADEGRGLAGVEVPDDLWELVLQCARRDEMIASAVETLEFSILAQHAHALAQLFHKLYHAHPVLPEEDEQLRRLRRAVFTLFLNEMRGILEELIGIPVPAEM